MKTKPLDLCEACREDIRKGDPITVLDGGTFHRRCYRAMKSGTTFVHKYRPSAADQQFQADVKILAIVLVKELHGG